MAALVRREQEAARAAGLPALYVDAGDHMDLSDLMCYATAGRVNRDLLAAAGCQAFTPGNNEVFRQSAAQLGELAVGASYPWLAANLRARDGGALPGVHDWTLLSAGPTVIGVFGLTVVVPSAWPQLGYSSPEAGETVRRAAAELRAAGAHLVVYLSHRGLPEDRAVAAGGHGVDLIIGGHTHDALDPAEVVAGVPIAQAGMFGEYVGRLHLTADLEHRRLVRCKSALLPVGLSGLPPDPASARVLARAAAERDAVLSQVLAVLPAALPHSMTGTSALAPRMAEALRRYWDAEIGLMVGGQALSGLPAGPVTRGDVIAACPGLLVPGLVEVQGSALLQMLEESEDPGRHNKQVLGAGLRGDGVVVGRVFTAGVTCRVDPCAPLGRRVRDVQVGGEPLQMGRWYRAGSPTLLGFTESGYDAATGVRVVRRALPGLVRDIFMQALQEGWV